MILLIDNYDSFTYNVKQEIEVLGYECRVVRNDQMTVAELLQLKPEKIVISPGPGRPEDAGVTLELMKSVAGKIPLFGICLGHQALGLFHGGKVIRAQKPMHGKMSTVSHQDRGVFEGLPSKIEVVRYHSLVIEKSSMPASLEVTATSEDGEVMGVRNVSMKQEGVQFHPESFATRDGRSMMKKFLERKES